MASYNTILTGEDRVAAAKDCRDYYDAGNSVRGVATRFGHSYGRAYELLKEAGTQFRDRNGRPRKAAV